MPPKGGDLVAQILAIQQRQGPRTHFPIRLPPRLLRLAQALRDAPSLDPEFLGAVPVAIVACLEGFFRVAIRELVDLGPPYSDRVRELEAMKDWKATLTVLEALRGSRFTYGEVVAHVVTIRSIDQMNAVMKTLLGNDFLKEMRSVRAPWVKRRKGPHAKVLRFPESVFASLQAAVEQRHIYAHELHVARRPSRDDAEAMLEAAVRLCEAAVEVIGEIVHPAGRGTDKEQEAEARLNALSQELDDAFEKYVSYNDEAPEWQQRHREAQACWLAYAKAIATVRSGPRNDTVFKRSWRLHYTYELIELTQSRLDEVKSLLSMWEHPPAGS